MWGFHQRTSQTRPDVSVYTTAKVGVVEIRMDGNPPNGTRTLLAMVPHICLLLADVGIPPTHITDQT